MYDTGDNLITYPNLTQPNQHILQKIKECVPQDNVRSKN